MRTLVSFGVVEIGRLEYERGTRAPIESSNPIIRMFEYKSDGRRRSSAFSNARGHIKDWCQRTPVNPCVYGVWACVPFCEFSSRLCTRIDPVQRLHPKTCHWHTHIQEIFSEGRARPIHYSIEYQVRVINLFRVCNAFHPFETVYSRWTWFIFYLSVEYNVCIFIICSHCLACYYENGCLFRFSWTCKKIICVVCVCQTAMDLSVFIHIIIYIRVL